MNKKIRVLHTFYIMDRGGAETMIMNVFRNIDRNKYEFSFLCENSKKGSYDDEIHNLGGKIYRLKPEKRRPIKNVLNIVKFLKETGSYDVIHIPNSFYSGIYCLAARIAGVKKIIVHSHNSKEQRKNTPGRKIYRSLMRFLINHFSSYRISCGDNAANYLYGTTKNIIMLNNGIDIDSFSKKCNEAKLKAGFGIKDEIVIGEVARFDPQKNHDFFIGLGEYIKKNKLKYKILLVGGGERFEPFYTSVKEKNLEDVIICTGPREDISTILKVMDVFVMPSFSEGFPVSVVESLASGTPCVLSDAIDKKVAVVPEMIRFESIKSDYSKWIKQIENAINAGVDEEYCLDKLRASNFDIKDTVKALENIYSDSLERKNV